MKHYLISLLITVIVINVNSQNIKMTGYTKIYYYRTIDHFFDGKKDSIFGDDLVYDYGKVSYKDKKTGKKVKFHLHKDSSIFAFKMSEDNSTSPIYAISKGEKRYGVFMGGSKDLFFVFYSRGNLYSTIYDKEKYIRAYSGQIDQFGYYLVFTKKGFESKKNGDVEFFIKDKEELYNKYIKEREDATTYGWNKEYILKQAEYVRAYNN